MKKIIIEVGSTCTKIDEFDGKNINHLKVITIEFKKNYLKENKIIENDKERLINEVNAVKENCDSIFIGGTSIFRTLSENERKDFLDEFKDRTGLDFKIISQEDENNLTVYGVTEGIDIPLIVFVGGGGSIELAVYDGEKVIENANSNFGAMDILNKFPDLSNDIASTDLEAVKEEIRKRINLPKNSAKVMVLAGGGHEKFARESGIRYVANSLYKDVKQPIMMSIANRKEDTEKYYKEISLDKIKANDIDPKWWNATRAMSAFVLEIAESLGVEYIVPTDVSMVYGIVSKG